MLSELLKFDVVDAAGVRGRLLDLEVELLEQEYPEVLGVHVWSLDGPKRLEWTEVNKVNSSKREIQVNDMRAAKLVGDHLERGRVLLKWDILDGLVIDLLNRRTTRATDLMLWISENRIELKGVDTGLVAMFRRITRGAFRGANRRGMFDWKYVEFLRGDPQAVDSGAGYHMRIARLPAGEIAQIADYIPYLHAAELLTLIENSKAARVLEAMSVERQVQVIEEFSPEYAADLLTQMSPDRATDLIGRLNVRITEQYLSAMPKRQREQIIDLLRYPEDTVGGAMINNILCLGERVTIASARQKVRAHSKQGNFISVIFATLTSEDRTLRGILTLRTLMDAEDGQKLSDVMDPYVVTLSPDDKAIDAAYRVITGQIAGMAVTDQEGKLIGAMTMEAAIGRVVPPGSALNSIKVFS